MGSDTLQQPDPVTNWPALPLAGWADTAATLHMWTQIVGKIRLALCPLVNHWWQVPLYVGVRGLSTSAMPYQDRALDIEFDFLDHNLAIRDSRGAAKFVPLYARSVADFHREFMAVLHSIGIDVKIWPKPVEVPDPIPFADDVIHASYDPEAVSRFHRILLRASAVIQQFRAEFLGKASPVNFFWGGFDLALGLYSGRRAPEREGADAMVREAYSHECIDVGFWPGSGALADPAFYAYAWPEPSGYPTSPVRPASAFYHPELKEFILMYDDVRRAPSPERTLLDFFESAFDAGANLANWDRAMVRRPLGLKTGSGSR